MSRKKNAKKSAKRSREQKSGKKQKESAPAKKELSQKEKCRSCIPYKALGFSAAMLLLAYMIIENPGITMKMHGYLFLVLGIAGIFVAYRNRKEGRSIQGFYWAFLAFCITAYLALFAIYVIAGLV